MAAASRDAGKTSQSAQVTEVFGAGPLRNLHGCAAAEALRGDASPCRGLAHATRRPQLGFGNPRAPLLFVSPSPLDPASAGEDPLAQWLEREAGLEHHLNAERVQPYFRFARAVLQGLRQRLGQAPGKNDLLELVFHTWVVRCPTQNPDRVTEGSSELCAGRHLEPLIASLKPRAIVALGGSPARYFWTRGGGTWETWRPIEQLHGRRLSYDAIKPAVPIVLCSHPYQRGADLHPEVISQALADTLPPDLLAPPVRKAA